MLSVTAVIQAALPYTHDSEVREALKDVVKAVESDLQDVGFEPSTETETRIRDLETVLNDFDERTSQHRAEMKEAMRLAREEDEVIDG